jgi:hypothetical protein
MPQPTRAQIQGPGQLVVRVAQGHRRSPLGLHFAALRLSTRLGPFPGSRQPLGDGLNASQPQRGALTPAQGNALGLRPPSRLGPFSGSRQPPGDGLSASTNPTAIRWPGQLETFSNVGLPVRGKPEACQSISWWLSESARDTTGNPILMARTPAGVPELSPRSQIELGNTPAEPTPPPPPQPQRSALTPAQGNALGLLPNRTWEHTCRANPAAAPPAPTGRLNPSPGQRPGSTPPSDLKP